MKLSDRDKKLIYIVVGILIIFCAYFFGYKKISAKCDDLDDEISANETLYNNLKQMAANEAQYVEDTEYYTSEYNTTIDSYDTGASTEYIIMFIDELEEKTDSWIETLGIGDSTQLYTFGQVASTNPINTGDNVYTSDYIGWDNTLTLSYQCSYANFKELINYINNEYEYKCKISTLSGSYDSEEDIVSGAITLEKYAITGSDREFLGAPVSTKYKGTENIFDSDTFTPSEDADEDGNNIITDYDYYISLDSFAADAESIAIGPKGSAKDASKVSINSEEREDIEIVFSGKKGDYTVAYKIGDTCYPVTDYDEGAPFDPGEMLSLLVISTDRSKEDGDVNGANATIINNTDTTLYIKVIDDDDNPRFKITEKSGDIVIYEE